MEAVGGGLGGPPATLPYPSSKTATPPSPPNNRQPHISSQELIQLVAEGVARAQQLTEPSPKRINTYRLKMKNPEDFDGKSTTAFNQWWESVTMYLGFYPETVD